MGGRGSVTGSLIGAFVIGVLADGLVMLGVSEFWQIVIRVRDRSGLSPLTNCNRVCRQGCFRISRVPMQRPDADGEAARFLSGSFSAGLLLAVVVLGAGCNRADRQKKLIAIVVPSQDNPYFKQRRTLLPHAP